MPTDIAEYHTSRARCHTKEKRKGRTQEREKAIKAVYAASGPGAKLASTDGGDNGNTVGSVVPEVSKDAEIPPEIVIAASRSTDTPASIPTLKRKPHPPNTQAPAIRPERPEMLNHLVLGLNEVIKALERQTDELRRRVMRIGDALAEQQNKGKRKRGQEGAGGDGLDGKSGEKGRRVLLPTAPPREDEEVEDEDMEEGGEASVPAVPISTTSAVDTAQPPDPTAQISPLEWLILPLLSLSPPTLASPIPAYCATFNTLIYQHTHLCKIARSRLPASTADDIIGEKWEEVRVVPLGRIEDDLAAMVGLRRMACLGIRVSCAILDSVI